MNFSQIQTDLKTHNVPDFRFKQLLTALNQGKLPLWPKELINQISFYSWTHSEVFTSIDGTKKAVLTLQDSKIIETVLIEPKPGHLSVCVSCEVGCPMNCAFCATGKMGFIRKLTAEEITDQVLFWILHIAPNKINSVVFMGMGEPFHNTEAVFQAIHDLNTYYGLGSRHISVSTCGIPDGIEAIQKKFPQVNLALSLHSTNHELRTQLMPITKAHPLSNLKPLLLSNRRQITFEYLLISGINDKPEDFEALILWLKDLNPALVHVNLIRYNQTYGTFTPTPVEKVRFWKRQLIHAGISVSIRKNLGVDIAGACGQLANIL